MCAPTQAALAHDMDQLRADVRATDAFTARLASFRALAQPSVAGGAGLGLAAGRGGAGGPYE